MWIVGGAGTYFCVSKPNRKKALFTFQLCFFSHITIVPAFGSVVLADMDFTVCFVGIVSRSFPGR